MHSTYPEAMPFPCLFNYKYYCSKDVGWHELLADPSPIWLLCDILWLRWHIWSMQFPSSSGLPWKNGRVRDLPRWGFRNLRVTWLLPPSKGSYHLWIIYEWHPEYHHHIYASAIIAAKQRFFEVSSCHWARNADACCCSFSGFEQRCMPPRKVGK